jgi:hypothetical protein
MPALSTITVLDREDTPVSHSFTPHSVKDGFLATLQENNGSVIDTNVMTISTTSTQTKTKVRIKLAVPIVQTETINGRSVDVVSHVNYIDTSITYDNLSTLQERRNIVGMFANSLGADQTTVDSVVTGLEGFY